jgi:LacI family transcriptional regulator
MRDVARKAGVSIKTVSRVVNDQGEISDETRQRILAVIDELGYRPNLLARGLVTQRTRTIGLVVPDITNPFFPEVARGVQDAAQAREYNTFLCNTDENPKTELHTLRSLAAQGVDGIIISPCSLTGDNLTVFAEQFRPLIALNHLCEHPNIGLVLSKNEEGARLAVAHLVQTGHRAIGMVAGLEASPLRGRRLRGFGEGLAAHGLPVVNEHIVTGAPTLEGGYQAALQLLTQAPSLTALFAYNDLMAIGAIRACQALGRRVPEDCAIIGFDDNYVAALVTPPLTTVRLDKYEMGRQATAALFAMMDDPEARPAPHYLEVELVVRASA